ncbi:MAG TPA: leucyl aminopeptidase [Gammaproteobacteria bacterium]|jgi:leucyl aminopeptidase|nr:leucyl aminopeptidase [Gammaproteobacteria bacterium]
MKFKLDASNIAKLRTDCVIIGIFENAELTPSAREVNKLSQGFLQKLLKNGEFQGKIGQTLLLYAVPNLGTKRILLVGCGKNTPLNARDYRKLMNVSISALTNAVVATVVNCLTELEVEKYAFPWKIKQAAEVIRAAIYRFDQFKSKKDPKPAIKEVILHASSDKAAKTALKQGLSIADGVEYTKNLANMPSNICTPTYVAAQAKTLAKEYPGLSIKILEEKDMQKLGMNAFLAVTKGTTEPAKLVCLEYRGGGKNEAPIAFVGKGITFDTGGISLKPADSMVGMKYDMCGSATVLGVLKTAAELKLPLNIVGVLALAENMPSGSATKPEDIVTSLSGQTIEIMNTDAEGRLVLCDALTYVERYKPDTVIDIATLTGAVVIALGYHASGMLSNHQPLAEALLAAGQESHDRLWQLPLWDEYQDQLKSPFADMSNVGGRSGGTITAACFLSRFAKKFHWAHLDVAGTAAMMGGADRYATGRPVPLLMQYLIHRAENKNAKN